jgi:hypothetical protein
VRHDVIEHHGTRRDTMRKTTDAQGVQGHVMGTGLLPSCIVATLTRRPAAFIMFTLLLPTG